MDQSRSLEVKYKKRDDASSRLAEKMLQGWTLLGVNCPNEVCATPLVRNKQGKMFCVCCERYAITEDEAKKEEEKKQMEAAKEAQAELEQKMKKRVEEEHETNKQAPAPIPPSPVAASTRASAPTSSPGTSYQSHVPISDQVGTVDSNEALLKKKTLEMIYVRIQELTSVLSTPDGKDRMLTLTQAIKDLCDAAKTLKSY